MRLRLLIALGVLALLALALLGVLFSTGRRLAATRRRLRQAHVPSAVSVAPAGRS